MTDLATLRRWLAEAEAARHELMLGQGLVRIRHNEREMTFTAAKKADLAAYIADLAGQIVRLERGLPVTGRRGRSRAVYF